MQNGWQLPAVGRHSDHMPARTLSVRPPSAADGTDLLDLWTASDLHVLGFVDCEEGDVTEDLGRPGLDLGRDYWLVHDGPTLAGAGSVLCRTGADSADVDVVLRPGADPGVGRELMGRVVARAAGQAGEAGREQVVLQAYAVTTDPVLQDLYRRTGWAAVRRFSRMLLDLGAEPPVPVPVPGVSLRGVTGEPAERELHAVMTSSFASHYGSTPETYPDWRARQAGRSGFDPGLWWLADLDGAPVGGLIGLRMAEQGWVQGVGVLPPYRSRGIARLLLLTAFAEFHRRGERRVALGVDTGNETGALRLYESIGMRAAQQHDAFELTVPRVT